MKLLSLFIFINLKYIQELNGSYCDCNQQYQYNQKECHSTKHNDYSIYLLMGLGL